MNRYSSPLFLFTVLIIISFAAPPSSATGLYLDLASYFSVPDTSRMYLVFRQSDMQRDEGRAALFAGELSVRPRERANVRLGAMYTSLGVGDDFVYGLADGAVRATYRVFGDSLDISGLFLRADLLVPIGAASVPLPFSSSSIDVGGGFEFRGATSLLGFRGAVTYTLAGDRRKEGEFIHRNFLTAALSLDFELRTGTSMYFTGFLIYFRGGCGREAYLLSIGQKLSHRMEIVAGGALEAGSDKDRIFNSAMIVSVVYRFPGGTPGGGK